MSGPTKRVRQIVIERDCHRCARCGKYLGVSSDYSLQHRVARGMGGSREPYINQPANLVTLCGSATTQCHGEVEQHRTQARMDGFSLGRHLDPSRLPVKTYRGWIRLDNEGGWREATGPTDIGIDTPQETA